MIIKEQRRKRELICGSEGTVFCPICYWTYLPKIDGQAHRRYHRTMMRIIHPVPDPRLAQFPAGDLRVDGTSPKWLHRLVFERARALRRLEGYDFTQWGEDHAPNENHIHAWLLIEPLYVPIGVIGFDWMDWEDIQHGWHLCFAWIADSYRRKGMLTKRWPSLIEKYGWFTIEQPISPAMKAFLFKVHYRSHLHPYADLHPE
jgi:hypothetical protein